MCFFNLKNNILNFTTIKTLNTTLIAIIFTIAICNAQSGVSFSLHQDVKFALIGDDARGYKAGTIDLLARFKMNGNQMKYGYVVVFTEFEYAEILGTYKRYSVNVGYVLNKLIVDDFEVNASLGWGWIDRYGKTMFSFGGSSEISYKLTDNLKVSLLGQLTERKDLMWLWGKNEIKPSLFFGMEYQF